MDVVYRQEVETPWGRLVLLATGRGLCYVGLPGTREAEVGRFLRKHFPSAGVKAGGEVNREAARQLRDYFAGRLRKFTVRLDLKADGFYREALLQVKAIPYGKTRTYGEIAASLKKPGAARAVGGANATNPIPIIIPCHRVVASQGLGGYGGGLKMKKSLLRLEGIDLK